MAHATLRTRRPRITLFLPKSSYYSPNVIETEPANIQTLHSLWAAAGSPRLGVSTGIRLPAGLRARSPALGGSAVDAVQFSERSSTPLIGHALAALSGVLSRRLSTQTYDAQGRRGPYAVANSTNAVAHETDFKENRSEEMKDDGTWCSPHTGFTYTE